MLRMIGAAAVLPVLGVGRGGVAGAAAEPMWVRDLEVVTITDTTLIVDGTGLAAALRMPVAA